MTKLNKRRPTVVRATKAKVAARNFIMEVGLKGPAVPVKKLIKKFARLFYFDNSDPDFAEEEGFIRFLKGEYRVYINQELPAGRDNFTYGHELGHVILKHHEEFDVDRLTDRELWRLDREANIFAAECLMPAHWVENSVQLPLTIQEIGRLKNLFDVSWEAIINRLDELDIHSKQATQALFDKWHNLRTTYRFPFITRAKPVIYIDINYCTSIRIRRMVVLSGDFKFPDIDENMRFIACPNCCNDDFSPDASFCKKCGQYLYNLCTNIENDPRLQTHWCGRPNVSDALYCEYCGAITVVGQMMNQEGAPTSENEDDFEIPF